MNNYTVSIKSLILLTALAAIFVLLTVNTVSATVNAPWTRVAVDTTSTTDIQCAKVGDADNDGDNEIISSNGSYIRMHEWSGTAWTLTTIDYLGTPTVNDLEIGNVDNTGRNKIAAALSNNTILLYNWTGSTWDGSVVSDQVDDGQAAGADYDVLDINAGDADNQGGNKTVAGTEGGEVVMFEWTAGSWSRTEIHDFAPPAKPVNNVDVADCNNDGSINVTTIADDRDINTFYYDGGWVMGDVDSPTTLLNLDIGDADNTAGNEIVVCSNSNDIYTYKWAAGSWTQGTVTSGVGADIYDIKIGDVYNDGTNRIVSGDENEYVKIYTWNTGTSLWDSFTVDDAAGGEVLEVTSGDADNDGLNEIVVGAGGDIYTYDSHFIISDVNAGGPYEAGETISVTWSLAGSASATEDYINVEYWDVTAGTPFNPTSNDTSATSSTSKALTGSEIGHKINVYVYTTSNSGGDNSTAITEGDPWPYLSVNAIQGPVITSCDKDGNEVNQFATGEKVYVKATGLEASTSYKIWLQNYAVTEGAALQTENDESSTQELVTTATNGSFGYGVGANSTPVLIWNISSTAAVTHHEHDIAVDHQSKGTVGTYNAADDGLDSASVAGIVAPVPEVSSLILFASGLMLTAVYFVYGRRGKGDRKGG